MERFALHPRLAADTIPLGDLALCRVLLVNDSRFAWLILVPRRANAIELFELDAADRARLTDETAECARVLKTITSADKMNIGTLGNVVPQLHIHVVARRAGDAAWPGPVWGHGTAVPYAAHAAKFLIERLRAALF